MLLALHRRAQRLLPLRSAALVVAAAGILAVTALLLVRHDPHDQTLRAALIVTMWALMLTAFLNLFRRPPPVVLPLLPLHEQVAARMQRLLYRVVAGGYLLLLVAVAGLSAKLLLLH